MKAKVILTGEIIEVKSLYPITYSRLDYNGKIIEEYDEDELEFILNSNRPKMVPLDKVCEWVKKHYMEYAHNSIGSECIIKDLRKAMEE